ncbi:MAG: ATPase [Oceanospirillales bacterium]|uniref:V/A-type H+-transporting ATPase subunit E n=1 Tax=Marinobacterium halophilum TaxID=267374 RepID=A0A2P8ET74_9GAMM|nr:ATPase [Marinobacterium halophilum]MBR9827802.1 ATPase [Oceanospirillales bacterium]PSL12679.1 V/A-type H+-transporting ATPase subunit E [Marinobacterium halophilum]
MTDQDKQHAASGVEALIERLKQQGVEEGQRQAAALVEEAQRRADWLLEQATQEAEKLRSKAREDAARLQRAGEDALKMAARDMNLQLREQLAQTFAERVRLRVSEPLDSEAFMRELIREVMIQACQDAKLCAMPKVELLLPAGVVGLEELRRNPHAYREGKLSQFVQEQLNLQLREGVSLDLHDGRGIRIRCNGDDAEIDLSDSALAELLLRHLQPRFRAILEGVIR